MEYLFEYYYVEANSLTLRVNICPLKKREVMSRKYRVDMTILRRNSRRSDRSSYLGFNLSYPDVGSDRILNQSILKLSLPTCEDRQDLGSLRYSLNIYY